jgi:hypothetical protein
MKKQIEHNQLPLSNTNGIDTSLMIGVKEQIAKQSATLLAQIASNICTYCTSIMKITQFNMKFLIFSPKIESHQMHPYSSPNAVRLNSKQLQLGLLIDFLKVSIDNLEKTVELEIDLINKNEHINDLIEIEKKQVFFLN